MGHSSHRLQPSSNTLYAGGGVSRLYVYLQSHAAAQSISWQTSNPSGAAVMQRLAKIPQAAWAADQTNSQIQNAVSNYINAAQADGGIPLLVIYHICGRDNGNYSAGGASSPAEYRDWIQNFAAGIGNRKVVIILEPDALIQLTLGLNQSQQQDRLDMLRYAITTLKALPRTYVYIDGGNPMAQPIAEIADRLNRAGVANADGFSLNVSNFFYTNDNVTYGKAVSSLIGNKHFVIDTSRNGNGPTSDYQWCNPSGRAFGPEPTVYPKLGGLVDALLWIKIPGESDGPQNGGPNSGVWWPEYVLELAQNTGW